AGRAVRGRRGADHRARPWTRPARGGGRPPVRALLPRRPVAGQAGRRRLGPGPLDREGSRGGARRPAGGPRPPGGRRGVHGRAARASLEVELLVLAQPVAAPRYGRRDEVEELTHLAGAAVPVLCPLRLDVQQHEVGVVWSGEERLVERVPQLALQLVVVDDPRLAGHRDEDVLVGIGVAHVHVLAPLDLPRLRGGPRREEPEAVLPALALGVHGPAVEPAVVADRREHRDLDVLDLVPELGAHLRWRGHVALLSPARALGRVTKG